MLLFRLRAKSCSVRCALILVACFCPSWPLLAQCEFASSKFVPSVPEEAGFYGNSVAVEGSVAVVGYPGADPVALQCGEAEVYRLIGGAWVLEQKLHPAGLSVGDLFGHRVAVHGNVVAVTAIGDDQAGVQAGAVYVFRFNGTRWIQEAKLTAPSPGDRNEFGQSLALGPDTILVGTPLDDEFGFDSGAVYCFTWNGVSWVQDQKLGSPDNDFYDRFGQSVSIDGSEVAAVGSPEDDDVTFGHGSVFVFRKQGGIWSFEQKLQSTKWHPYSRFGWSVGVDGGWVVVGDPYDNPGGVSFSGSASVFELVGNLWTYRQQLRAFDPDDVRLFGTSVDIDGDRILCGVPSGKVGPNGQARAYRQSDGFFVLERILASDQPQLPDTFGDAVAVSADHYWVGATGSLEGGFRQAGAAYAFTRDPIMLELLGTPARGQSVQYRISNATGEAGNLAWVLLDCSGNSLGISLPNDPRDIPLTLDICTRFSLRVSPALQGIVDGNGVALTPPHTFPFLFVGARFFASAVTVDLVSNTFESVLCPISYETQ